MKPFLSICLFAALLVLLSCSVTTTRYYPGYRNDYIYSVGYYGYRPYWGSPSYGWNNGYWAYRRGVYYSPSPGWYNPHYSRAWYGYVSRW